MNLQQNVKDYYGKTLSGSKDLQTDACQTFDAPPDYLKDALAKVHPDVRARYYGCGLIAPLALRGARILDLGSGAGQDAYVLAQLAGPKGEVTGVDMTPEQLAVARAHEEWHAREFGFHNVAFVEGDLERLGDLKLEKGSYDIIVSNCVINLVEDKSAVFRAAYELLKPGGEFYFSDVYADRRLDETLRHDPEAQGECLAGALYWNDFLTLAKDAGFVDPRLVTDRKLAINNPVLDQKLAPAQFHSATYRLFKVEGLEPSCEDYGQAVMYRGGVPYSETQFVLDNHHTIDKGRIFPVCGNTYRILNESRFSAYFDFFGDWSAHHGIFPGCGTVSPFSQDSAEIATSGSCC